jgi:hypothetical protein
MLSRLIQLFSLETYNLRLERTTNPNDFLRCAHLFTNSASQLNMPAVLNIFSIFSRGRTKRSSPCRQKPIRRGGLPQSKSKGTSGRPDDEIIRQLKTNNRLRRNLNVPIPRQATQRRASTRADQTANQQPDTAAGHAAH